MARYEIQNTLWWVGVSGLDGIRQDTLPYVHRRFWKEWMAAIKKEYPDLRVVGELLDGDPALVSFFQGGRRALRRDRLRGRHALRLPALLQDPRRLREGRARCARSRRCWPATTCTATLPSLVTLLGLHDVPRFMSEPGATRRLAAAAPSRSCSPRAARRSSTTATRSRSRAGSTRTTVATSPAASRATRRTPSRPRGRTADEAVRARARPRPAAAAAGDAALRRGRTVNLHVADKTWVYARVARRAGAPSVGDQHRRRSAADARPGRSPPSASPTAARLRDRLGSGASAVGRGGPPAARPCRPARRRCSSRRSNDPLDLSAIIHEVS